MLPPWPAEEFLRELVRFAEKNTTWAEDKSIMEAKIAKRLAAKRTKKYKWLTSRDIAEKAVVEKKRLRGRKTNNEEAPVGQEARTSKPPSPQLSISNEPSSDLAGIPPNLEAGQETESTPSSNSTAPQPLPTRLVEAEPSTPDDEGQDKDSDEVGDARNVETSGRKRRRPSEGGKRKKFRIDIPVINLNVEEGVDELKRRAGDDEEKDDAIAVEEALKSLTAGEGSRDAGVLKRRLEKLLGTSRAEVEVVGLD